MKQSTAVFQGSSGALTPTVTPYPASCSGLHLGLQYMGHMHSINTDINGATFPQCPSPHSFTLLYKLSQPTPTQIGRTHMCTHPPPLLTVVSLMGKRAKHHKQRPLGYNVHHSHTHTHTPHSYSHDHVCMKHMHPFCYV